MVEDDVRPVVDRLGGIPVPSESIAVEGHSTALDQLTRSYSSGRMHHAWLINGERGIGKSTLAFTLARHILSHPDQSKAPELFDPASIPENVSRQVANGGHPELLHLARPWDAKGKRFKTQLSVDEVRRTQQFYSLTAGAGGWRICIVDAADEMNGNAANALLKILEEPPRRSIFLVLSHVAGSLLPTIRSRCQSLALSPLPTDQVSNLLTGFKTGATEGDIVHASQLGGGSVRKSIQLLQSEVLTDYAIFEEMMSAGANGSPKDWVGAHAIAEGLSRRGQEEAFNLFVDLAMGWLGRQVRSNAHQPASALAGWAEVWEKASRSLTLADAFNLDRKQVLLSFFGNLFAQNRA